MERLGIILNFKDKIIAVNQITSPMRHLSSIQTTKSCYKIWLQTKYVEPAVTEEAAKQVVRILDVKYKKAYLPSIVKKDSMYLTRAQCISYCNYFKNLKSFLMARLEIGRLALSILN